MTLLALALAGAVGACARFVVVGLVQTRRPGPFPWGTLTVNLVGSFVLGLVTAAVLRHQAGDLLKIAIGTGFCGAFTTFSTFAVETVRLFARSARTAVTNVVVTTLGCLLAAALGLLVG